MSDIGPGRGSKPKYLGRALTEAERARVYRARKAGKPVPVLDPYAELRAAWDAWDDVYNPNQSQRVKDELTKLLEKHKC